MRIRVKQSWLSVASGVLYGLAWEPFGLWPLAVIGWAGWMWGLTTRDSDLDRSALFLHSLLFVLSAWGIAFHWVLAHPMAVAATTSGSALLAYAMLFAALTSWVVSAVGPGTPTKLPAAILAVMLFELTISYGPFAMPWLALGWSAAPSSWALSMGSWAGSQGAGLVLLVMAALTTGACRAWPFARKRSVLMLAGAVFLMVVPSVHTTDVALSEDDRLQVRILEPGTSPEEWSDVLDVSRVDAFAGALTAAIPHLPPADITVLPETALPMGPADSLRAWAFALSGAAESPVLTGGIEIGRPDATGRAFNVIISSSDAALPYAKRRLVPFAEHVPFSEWIPGFNRLSVPSGGVSGYAKGERHDVVRSGDLEIIPLICFESLFDRDARAALLRGGSLLAVLTQDGWWDSDVPRRQHLAFSRMLAASTGHPLIHATVDGMSGLIDAGGHLLPLTRDHGQVLSGALPMETRNTLFMKVGNRPFFAIFAALFVVSSFGAFNHRRSSSPGKRHS